jgi:hypothetical protein
MHRDILPDTTGVEYFKEMANKHSAILKSQHESLLVSYRAYCKRHKVDPYEDPSLTDIRIHMEIMEKFFPLNNPPTV